ncbi:hypothetical protein DXH95_14820 [Sphingorhabdus pulchriflava]|uniref:TonB-dependent receptor n=1 Tax=Sphingorhabdus pulchriflava TaxID=2292257 RepID=A0A371B1U1_9SPHN|nr:hypothetical protein [Sphingorhabdus pulchriflava]RDV01559.1 hypothetical protein DXH95_14820 [Sphingorhabdus pulchriflava]
MKLCTCRIFAASGSVLAMAVAQPALANTSAAAPQFEETRTDLEPRAENGRQIYEASQFTRFAPQTALDMVGQIPGFQISQVSTDRGLGEASQNVLINGQRITGKSNDAQTALSRIAASSVIQLEIADGATLNVSGLNGQVLNVITKPDALQGNFAWRPQWRRRVEDFWINGEVNLSGKLGKGDFTLGLSNKDGFRGGGWGYEDVRDADGDRLFFRDVRVRSQGDRPRLAGTYSLKSDNGNILNANGALEFFEFRGNRTFLKQETGKANILEAGKDREDEWNMELGADYEFGLGGGRLKVIGFHRFEHSPFVNQFRITPTDGSAESGQIFAQVIDEGESVLRAEYRWKAGKTDWQVSAEGAFNYLDAESEFFRLDNAGVFQPVPLPNATARVEEKRGQIILSYGRPIAKDLTLQATLGGEYSELGVTGPNGNARQYVRPKGSIALGWKPSPVLDISAKFQRKVLQLNFGDFLASVDVRNNNNNAGNFDLVPPQSWLLNFEANRSLGKAGSLKLKVDLESISDLVDRIPITATTEAPGNIDGTARRLRTEINASLLLDTIGIKGAKLDLIGAWQTASLRDPLTGEKRPLSNRGRTYWNLDFRHDIPNSQWAYGGFAEDSSDYGFYRLDYFGRDYRTGPMVGAFIEHKNVLGLKVRGQIINLAGQTEGYDEIFYVDRRDGPVDFTHTGRNKYGLIYRATVSGTF